MCTSENRSNLRWHTSKCITADFGATCISFFLHKLEHVMSLFPQSSISKQYCRRGYRFDKMIWFEVSKRQSLEVLRFRSMFVGHFVICVFVGCHNIFFQHLLLSKSVVILLIRVLILTRVSKTLKKFVYLDSICLQSKKKINISLLQSLIAHSCTVSSLQMPVVSVVREPYIYVHTKWLS